MQTRFHFHLVKGHQRVNDLAGYEARYEEVRSPAVLKLIAARWPGTADRAGWQGWLIEITDPEGRIVRTIALD